jgi:hypothetical protein
MADRIQILSLERLIYSITSGTRFVFGGVAGALGYRLVRAEGPIELELLLFGLLIFMVAIVEYSLRTVEPANGDISKKDGGEDA